MVGDMDNGRAAFSATSSLVHTSARLTRLGARGVVAWATGQAAALVAAAVEVVVPSSGLKRLACVSSCRRTMRTVKATATARPTMAGALLQGVRRSLPLSRSHFSCHSSTLKSMLM
jgi:hypothetical protein